MDPPRQISGGTFEAVVLGAFILGLCYIIVWPGTKTFLSYYHCKFFHKVTSQWWNNEGHHFRCECGKEWDS